MFLEKRSVQIEEQEQVETYFVRCNMKDLVMSLMTFCLFTSYAKKFYILPAFHRLVITGLIQVCKIS